jgi:hypothetical protein
MRLAAASYALTGRRIEAGRMIARLCQFDPALRLSNLTDVLTPFQHSVDRDKFVDGLQKAGLPE